MKVGEMKTTNDLRFFIFPTFALAFTVCHKWNKQMDTNNSNIEDRGVHQDHKEHFEFYVSDQYQYIMS